MMDGIRRRFAKPTEERSWDANEELTRGLEDNNDLPEDNPLQSAAPRPSGEYIPANPDSPDYYKRLVQTAIDNGGWHGDHRIPIPWLRMILAGLELRHIEPEMMWYGADGEETADDPRPSSPSYNDLFPSSQGTPSGLS